jgi:hypothetical protein
MTNEHVNDFDSDFWTPLMHAVEDGDKERFESLIAAGADVNLGNVEGEQYPITIAAELEVEAYCCPVCNMWYGFNQADLFDSAMFSGSIRIATYLRSCGVRPWSKTRSMGSGEWTIRQLAEWRHSEAFLASIFTPLELSSRQDESDDSSR